MRNFLRFFDHSRSSCIFCIFSSVAELSGSRGGFGGGRDSVHSENFVAFIVCNLGLRGLRNYWSWQSDISIYLKI